MQGNAQTGKSEIITPSTAVPGTIKLREHQIDQCNFVDWRLDMANTVGIESPTGSGKTFVILELARQFIASHPLSNVVISTGFNNLVFLMEDRARQAGLHPIVLVGVRALNCPVEWEEVHGANEPYRPFDRNNSALCGSKHHHLDRSHPIDERVCPFVDAAYKNLIETIASGHGNIIITNHSMYLAMMNHPSNIWGNVDLALIDEAHTFNMYYESYMRLELDLKDLQAIDKAASQIKQPMQMIIKKNMANGKALPSQQVDALVSCIKSMDLKSKTMQFFSTKPGPENYITMEPNMYAVDRFYRYFDLPVHPKTVLLSATLDRFTLGMFRVRKDDVYVEKRKFVEYEKSEFVYVPGDCFNQSFQRFLDHVHGKGLRFGLCLSTTIADVKNAMSMDGYLGFHMIDNLDEFVNIVQNADAEMDVDKPSVVLCGSRALFQGIDIPQLQFVCLNKLPFPVPDEKSMHQQSFLESKPGFNAWRDFVEPKVENDILQSTGRLWRGPEDQGTIGIFDERCIGKFSYMVKRCIKDRRCGIKCMQLLYDKNGEFKGQEEIWNK